MTSTSALFNEQHVLKYLGLPMTGYEPSPKDSPVDFLLKHLQELPPHLASHFSLITNPKQRTVVPTIRNRRLRYTAGNPEELGFVEAKNSWPLLWSGHERRGIDEGKKEKEWAGKGFLEGQTKHIGKLGSLLGDYEEEREAERVRIMRRERAREMERESELIPEEDDDSDEELDDTAKAGEEESEVEARAAFERLIKERFIYGLLESNVYNKVDWDETLDEEDDREAEERWFDEEDEDDTPAMAL